MNEKIYTLVDVEASYEKLGNLLRKFNPNDSTECFQGGSLYVDFVVHNDGTLTNFKWNNGSTISCPAFIDELIRVLKYTSGKWQPAIVNDKKVCSYKKVGFSCLYPFED